MILRVLFDSSLSGQEKLAVIIPHIIVVLVIVFVVLPIHELAHGFVAHKLGDDTAKRQGRLTFNPIASIDPIGALFILLFGFGWARPVPVNPYNFKNRRVGMALTAFAGPFANLLTGFLAAVAYVGVFLLTGRTGPEWLYNGFEHFIVINVALAVFNLLPIPPLDGSKVLGAFLPTKVEMQFQKYQRIIIPIMFILIFSGAFSGPLWWLEDHCLTGVMWLAKLPFWIFGAVV